MNLYNYYEKMETECSLQGSPILNTRAIRIDGSGVDSLKYIICQNSLKSCDYIKSKKTSIYYIEFSDLNAQLINLKTVYDTLILTIDQTDVSALQRAKILYKPINVIKSELQSKISENFLFIDLLSQQCNLSKTLNKSKHFFIAICSINPSDIIIFDQMLREIQRKFSDLVSLKLKPYNRIESFII